MVQGSLFVCIRVLRPYYANTLLTIESKAFTNLLWRISEVATFAQIEGNNCWISKQEEIEKLELPIEESVDDAKEAPEILCKV